jgi:hypothetical protein
MKEKLSAEKPNDCSAINIEISITAEWINTFLRKQSVTIPLSDQYNLSNLKIELGEGKVSMEADIKEKDNSSIKLDCIPVWKIKDQQFTIQDIELQTETKNLLLKSAGWFANTFMSAKLDQKIARTLNTMFKAKKEELMMRGLAIPIPEGSGRVQIQSIQIMDLQFKFSAIAVKAQIDGKLVIGLGESELPV